MSYEGYEVCGSWERGSSASVRGEAKDTNDELMPASLQLRAYQARSADFDVKLAYELTCCGQLRYVEYLVSSSLQSIMRQGGDESCT